MRTDGTGSGAEAPTEGRGSMSAPVPVDAPGRAPAPPGDPREQELLRARLRARLFGELEMPVRIGRFRVLSVLGHGGMGVVYEARDERLDRIVAIKLIRDGERGPRERARLLAEARAQAQLSHPNVVQIHEVDQFDDDVFIVMELVRGVTLDAWLAASPRSVTEVLAVFAAAGRGLAAAHAAGLVHRDIKPSNILVGDDGWVRIADFGLARGRSDAAPDELASTQPSWTPAAVLSTNTLSAAAGTPAYMSPEHVIGRTNARSDQFSFCVALYEALVGRHPFAPDSEAPARELPRWLRPVLARGLSFEPGKRFASMTELLTELEPRSYTRWWFVSASVALGLAGAIVGALVSRAPAVVQAEPRLHDPADGAEPSPPQASEATADESTYSDSPLFLDVCLDTRAKALCDDGPALVELGCDGDCATCEADVGCSTGSGCINLVYQADSCTLETDCLEIRRRSPGAASGRYLVDPDGNGSTPAFSVWCDMATQDGGWTLVWKQTAFGFTNILYSAQLLGSPLLQSEEFDGTTQGSLVSLFEYGEILFKSSPSLWVRIEDRFEDWTSATEDRAAICRDISKVMHTCSGVDCSVFNHLAVRYAAVHESVSGFIMGPFSYNRPNPECGATWCNSKHGRYDGLCASGPKGEGNWMVFVR